MTLNDTKHLKGRVKIVLEDLETGEKKVIEKDNLIVDVGANLVRDFLANTSGLSGLSHLEIGPDDTAPAANQTSLLGPDTERFRKAFTDVVTVNNREVKFVTFIGASEWSGTVGELGLFGNGATDTLGTGTMFSRVTVTPFSKSTSSALTVEWTITL